MEVSPISIAVPILPSAPAVVEAVKELDTENKADSNAEGGDQGDLSKQGSPLQSKSIQQLTQEEQAELQQLQQRDREVRSHEAAHKSAAGRFAQGGASFEYQRGPDGQQYAVGGEVSIDTSRPEDPHQALIKAQIIQRAATAPAQPSAQDRAVASEAASMIAEAQIAIQQERQAKTEAKSEGDEDSEQAIDSQESGNPSARISAYQQEQQGIPDIIVEPVNLIV